MGLDEVGCVPGVLKRVPEVPQLSWVSPCFSQLRLCLPSALGYTSHPFLFVAGLENELPHMKEDGVFGDQTYRYATPLGGSGLRTRLKTPNLLT